MANFWKALLTPEIWAPPLWPRSLHLHPQIGKQNPRITSWLGQDQRGHWATPLPPQQTSAAAKPTPAKGCLLFGEKHWSYPDRLSWCLSAIVNQKLLTANSENAPVLSEVL